MDEQLQINHDNRLYLLFDSVREELIWIMLLILFRDPIVSSSRRQVKTTSESTYLFQNKETGRVDYSGSTMYPESRIYGHDSIKRLGEVFNILVFKMTDDPLISRLALESLGKIVFQPELCGDINKASLTPEKIYALKARLREWIDRKENLTMRDILRAYIPLSEIVLTESDQHSNWETYPGAKAKMVFRPK